MDSNQFPQPNMGHPDLLYGNFDEIFGTMLDNDDNTDAAVIPVATEAAINVINRGTFNPFVDARLRGEATQSESLFYSNSNNELISDMSPSTATSSSYLDGDMILHDRSMSHATAASNNNGARQDHLATLQTNDEYDPRVSMQQVVNQGYVADHARQSQPTAENSLSLAQIFAANSLSTAARASSSTGGVSGSSVNRPTHSSAAGGSGVNSSIGIGIGGNSSSSGGGGGGGSGGRPSNFTNPSGIRKPSRASGVIAEGSLPSHVNKPPQQGPGRPGARRRAAGANDPENIFLVNCVETRGMGWQAIADALNRKRIAAGLAANFTANAVHNRYNRNAPVLFAAEGRAFVPVKRRRAMMRGGGGSGGSGARGDGDGGCGGGVGGGDGDRRISSMWNEERDDVLREVVREVEADKWARVARMFNERTGENISGSSAAYRNKIL